MRPMLAGPAPSNLASLKYPLLASPKLDGIRCIIKNGVALSRNLKPIRNEYIQDILALSALEGFDGELIVGDPTSPTCMRDTNSGVMSIRGEPDFTFYVFDYWNRGDSPYLIKLAELSWAVRALPSLPIELHTSDIFTTPTEVEQEEAKVLEAGYEGLILRNPDAGYKFGRSTTREQKLLKLKRYHQAEGRIVGFKPWFHNANDPILNELGYTSRSKASDGLVELEMLGAFEVESPSPSHPHSLVTFDVGTGFTLEERRILWEQRFDCIGRYITYKYFPYGVKDKPRQPVWVSFRDLIDFDL